MNLQIKELIDTLGTDVSGKWISVDKIQQLTESIIQECAYIALREDHDPSECILNHFGLQRKGE
jgi:hypothetical protein